MKKRIGFFRRNRIRAGTKNKKKLIKLKKSQPQPPKKIQKLQKIQKKIQKPQKAQKIQKIQELQKEMPEIKKKLKKIKKSLGVKAEKVITNYDVECEEIVAEVKIVENIEGRFYKLKIPAVSEATSALLENVKQKLIITEPISIDLSNPSVVRETKRKIREKAMNIFQRQYDLDEKSSRLLAGILVNEMLGLGNIELLLADPWLEEIVIPSSKENIRVYHRKYGWLITNLFIKTEKEIENYASIIARHIGRQITTLSPMLDAHLLSGDRVNAVLAPINTKGNTITIRKFAREPWTVIDFIQNNTCSAEVFALLWTAIQYELNILFSGGTASGKTTMLNVCMPFIPPYHRIVSIEDTRELQLPGFLFWSPLVVRLPNPEGKGGISMLDLVVNSLRMRPDRIILGEIRRQREAEVLFEAMHTGHSVYATVHADTAAETIIRLTNPPINVPTNMLNAVDISVVLFRDRKKNIRRVYQVAEFIREKSGEEASVRANIIYRWDSAKDKIVKHSKSLKIFDELARRTVLSREDITRDISDKKEILRYLARKNIRGIEQVGKIIHRYYTDPKSVKKLVRIK